MRWIAAVLLLLCGSAEASHNTRMPLLTGLQIETQAIRQATNRLSGGTSITNLRLHAIDRYVKTTKGCGFWFKRDLIYDLFGAETATNAHLNWKAPGTFTLVSNGSADAHFVSGRGFFPDGSTDFYNTTWVPATNGVKWQTTDASVDVYEPTQTGVAAANLAVIGTAGNLALDTQTGGAQYNTAINTTTISIVSGASATSVGYTAGSRSGGTISIYKNGVFQNSVAAVGSANVTVRPVYIGARNNAGTADSFTTHATSFATFGSSVTAAEAACASVAALTYTTDTLLHGGVLYVSNVNVNGIPIGNDANPGTIALPLLTLNKALTSAGSGAHIILNGDPAAPATYNKAGTFYRVLTSMSIDCFLPFCAKITSIAGSPVMSLEPGSGGRVTIGAIICDGQTTSTYCFAYDQLASSQFQVTFNSTKAKDVTTFAWTDSTSGSPTSHAYVTYNTVTCTLGLGRSCISQQFLAADAAAIINSPVLTITNSTNAGNATVQLNGIGATGAVASLTNGTISVTADAAIVGTQLVGVQIHNVFGVPVTNNSITVDATPTSGGSNISMVALALRPSFDALQLNSGKCTISGNTLVGLGTSGGGAVAYNGWEGNDRLASNFTNVNPLLQGCVIENNVFSSNLAAQAAAVHGIFFQGNAIIRRNIVHLTGIAYVAKETGSGFQVYDNQAYDFTSAGFLCKAAGTGTWTHNTGAQIIGQSSNGAFYCDANPSTGNNNLLQTFIGNIAYGTVNNSTLIKTDASQPTAFFYTDAFNTGTLGNAWTCLGVAMNLAAWRLSACGSATEFNLNPQFINAPGANYDISHAATGMDVVPPQTGITTDILNRTFANLATAGAYQRQ